MNALAAQAGGARPPEPLPPLRQELALFPGPAGRDGAPSWSLHDPVRNQFFRIDWLTFEILARWSLGSAQAVAEAVAAETPLQPSADDVEQVRRFVTGSELTQRHGPRDSAWLHQQAQRHRQSAALWLLHHYLFFRVPLWRPDAWLGRAAAWVAPLYSRGFALLTLLAMTVGLLEVSSQWTRFSSTLLDTLSWQGLAGYGVSLVGVKFLHELGHAFTAKRHGCRVPTMGVAFLVMFPVAYTDINEVWKLPDRRRRLAVGAAGIVTELVVAAWATLAWALLPDGPARGGAFLLATTTWVSTLAVNASPFMRFDGYFLLMDWLDLPNLHARAFALARWQLRRVLFGLREAVPEHVGQRLHMGLVGFAWGTWLYRLVVFGGIAAMVFHAFPKPLGPLLGGVEVAWFIALPLLTELKAWGQRAQAIVRSPHAWVCLALAAAALAAVLLPWDTRVHAQGVLRPARSLVVVAPAGARLQQLRVPEGAQVVEGELLALLESPDLPYQQSAALARQRTLDWQVDAAGVDARLRDRRPVADAERLRVRAELQGLARQQERHGLRAPQAGRLFWLQPDLAAGDWLRKDERVAVVADLGHWRVDLYLPESELARVEPGARARFYPESSGQALPLRVIAIDRDATHSLPDGLLASTRGGAVLVREQNHQFVPETALYRVSLEMPGDVAPPSTPQVLRGSVVIQGRAKPWADDLVRSMAALWQREAGF